MTTAREQARKAAAAQFTSVTAQNYAKIGADTASNVWEPLLREALAALALNAPDHVLIKKFKEAFG